MLRRRFLTALFCSLLTLPAMSAPYENADVSLTLPDGFSGPVLRKQSEQRYTLIFGKSYKDDPTKTILQITVTTQEPKPVPLGEADLQVQANRHLAENMADLARHRQDFSAAPPEKLTLSGLPAVRGSWKGTLQGKKVTGTLYTVSNGKQLFLLQSQDIVRSSSEGLKQAAQAIEAIKLKDRP